MICSFGGRKIEPHAHEIRETQRLVWWAKHILARQGSRTSMGVYIGVSIGIYMGIYMRTSFFFNLCVQLNR